MSVHSGMLLNGVGQCGLICSSSQPFPNLQVTRHPRYTIWISRDVFGKAWDVAAAPRSCHSLQQQPSTVIRKLSKRTQASIYGPRYVRSVSCHPVEPSDVIFAFQHTWLWSAGSSHKFGAPFSGCAAPKSPSDECLSDSFRL